MKVYQSGDVLQDNVGVAVRKLKLRRNCMMGLDSDPKKAHSEPRPQPHRDAVKRPEERYSHQTFKEYV